MVVFEMFHSPPCALDHIGCDVSEFIAQIVLNLIWGVVLGASVGITLAAIMLLARRCSPHSSLGEFHTAPRSSCACDRGHPDRVRDGPRPISIRQAVIRERPSVATRQAG